MKEFPLEKYHFIIAGRKVIALSTYAGKTVRGIAICSENDEFDLNKGKEIAAARCAYKIAIKRFERARNKSIEALEASKAARDHWEDMMFYLSDSEDRLLEAENKLNELTK